MANATFNAGIDYFGFTSAAVPKLRVKSSAENRSKQSASGNNSYGDTIVVDSYGETAAPSAEYDVIAAFNDTNFPNLGTVSTVEGIENPVVLGSITINTATGQNPTVSASGQMVQSGATTLRKYPLPTFSVTPRHRAQDFLCTKEGTTYTPIMAIKKTSGNTSVSASDINDYSLESVSATLPIEITLAQPKGEVVNYDLHGGMGTATYTVNWYASDAPVIGLTTAAVTAGFTMSSPLSKSDPEGGYTQYTWTVSFPFKGSEYVAPTGG